MQRLRLWLWAKRIVFRHRRTVAAIIGAPALTRTHVRIVRTAPASVPAWTEGDTIFLTSSWFAAHPDDIGCVLHELSHALMRAPVSDARTRWLIEGIADYVRDVLGYATAWSSPHFAQGLALAGYQTTAHFLFYLEERYPGVVRRLGRLLSLGMYDARIFEEYCGYPLEALVAQYEEWNLNDHGAP